MRNGGRPARLFFRFDSCGQNPFRFDQRAGQAIRLRTLRRQDFDRPGQGGFELRNLPAAAMNRFNPLAHPLLLALSGLSIS
jgi:hypothetical protein